jgi:hypothetical protein
MSRSRWGSNIEGESSEISGASFWDEALSPSDNRRDRDQLRRGGSLGCGMGDNAEGTVSMSRRQQFVAVRDGKSSGQRNQKHAQQTQE